MENSTAPTLGMSSFSAKDQKNFGQNVRLAMACIEGTTIPTNTKAMPTDEHAIRHRLITINQDITSNQADMLELLVRFDELQGWKVSGSKSCAAWMNLEMGICHKTSWDYLRVGRYLRKLPTTTALFKVGKLSWSKVRLLASVANADTEKTLCHAALDASVSQVAFLCSQYKWEKEADNSDTDADNARAMQQWNSRSFSWSETSNGSTRIQITLPPEIAQVILKSVEHSLNTESTDNLSQCRADAAVRMAEASLQAAGKHISSADRYQVVVSVDAATLNNTAASLEKRPIISGANPIATETAKRIACDCSITKNTLLNGELLDIGRKSRIWTTAQERAIKNRDRHCQFPGCTEARYLQIHHIEHWADGGSTSIENGVCLCTGCHTKVHEGGYTLQRVDNNPQLINEQFKDQQHKDDLTMFDFEKSLRANRDSFDTIRQLSPTRYRFRVIGPKGVYPFNSARAECSEANPPAYRFTPFSPRNNAAPAPHHLPDPCCLQC